VLLQECQKSSPPATYEAQTGQPEAEEGERGGFGDGYGRLAKQCRALTATVIIHVPIEKIRIHKRAG